MAQLRAKQIKLVNEGDLLIGGASGNGSVLAKGTAGQVLKVLAGGALGYEKAAAVDTTITAIDGLAASDVQGALAEIAANLAAEAGERGDAVNALQSELDATQVGAGLGTDGAYASHTAFDADTNPAGAHYINTATSLHDADKILDAKIKEVADLAGTGTAGVQAELDQVEDSVGLNADGTYTQVANSNYLGSATTVKGSLAALDNALKSEADRAVAAEEALDGRLDTAEATITDHGTRLTTAEGKIAGLETQAGDIQAELDRAEAALGLEANGDKALWANGNYIVAGSAGSGVEGEEGYVAPVAGDTFKVAIEKLDAALKVEETARGQAVTDLQAELDATQAGAGLGVDGAYVAETTSNYINSATSLKSADMLLDAAIKAVADDVAEMGTGAIAALQAEVDAIEATLGLGENSDGTMIDYTSVNYIGIRDTFKAAIEKLDSALKGVDTDYKAADENLQQQLNSLVGLDALVFKGNFAGDMTAEDLAAVVADNGDVYRISSNPAADFAGLGFDVNIGDFVAKTAEGWVKFDNTDPVLESGDASIVVGGNTFDGYSLSLSKKSLTSANGAITVTGGTDSVLADVALTFNAGSVNFSDLAQTGTKADGFLKWNTETSALEYVAVSALKTALGVTIHAEEDFTPATAANASVTLAHTPVDGSVAVFINGVKLRKTGFTVTGTTVSVDDAINGYGVETGDVVSVSYDYAA